MNAPCFARCSDDERARTVRSNVERPHVRTARGVRKAATPPRFRPGTIAHRRDIRRWLRSSPRRSRHRLLSLRRRGWEGWTPGRSCSILQVRPDERRASPARPDRLRCLQACRPPEEYRFPAAIAPCRYRRCRTCPWSLQKRLLESSNQDLIVKYMSTAL